MKKTTFLLAAASSLLFLSACKDNQSQLPQGMRDTTGLAEFQAMKAAKEQHNARVAKRTSTNAKTVSMESSTTNEAKVTQKKGWSKAAKYAVIGGAGGAVMGAVINKKNRVKGAVIGGVLGGGGGYVIGRSQDKKDGRY